MRSSIISPLLLALALGLGASACGTAPGSDSGNNPDPGPGPDPIPRLPEHGESWTVLVYMVADNDLEPFGLEDLEEMTRAGASDDFRIVVQSDRASDYSDDGVGGLPDWQSTKRLLVQQDALVELDDLGERNMGDPATLAEFITWGVNSYPADRYALVFWDHGSGWVGFGGDESTSDHDRLDIAELRRGIDQGLAGTALEGFALIGFDACLMATFELALAMRDYGAYLLASEELEPGHGWDYEHLRGLRDDPARGPVAMGELLMGGFAEQAAAQDTDATITLSLVDLQALAPLESAVDALAEQLRREFDVTAAYLGRQRQASQRFGETADLSYASNLVDLGDLAGRLGLDYGPLSETTGKVRAALRGAVVAEVHGAAIDHAYGLSIYFPPQRPYYDIGYRDIAGDSAWNRMLEDYYDMGESGLFAPPRFTNPGGVADVEFYQDGMALFGDLATDGAENIAEALLYYGVVSDDGREVFLLGEEPANDSATSVDGFWDYSALTIQQGGAFSYLYISIDALDGGDIALTIPFAYVPPGGGEPLFALLVYVLDSDYYVLQETYYLFSDAGPGEFTPQIGGVLDPLGLIIDQAGEYQWDYLSDNSFDPTRPFELRFEELPLGIIGYLELEVSDFAGNVDYVYFEGEV